MNVFIWGFVSYVIIPHRFYTQMMYLITASRNCHVKNFFISSGRCIIRPNELLYRPDDIVIRPDDIVIRPDDTLIWISISFGRYIWIRKISYSFLHEHYYLISFGLFRRLWLPMIIHTIVTFFNVCFKLKKKETNTMKLAYEKLWYFKYLDNA